MSTSDPQARRGSGWEAMQRSLAAEAVAAAGYLGGGTVTGRPTSITWTFPSSGVPALCLVQAARGAADRLNPGTWVVTADAWSDCAG